MERYCTCGAEFVEGARFCHKCGRPADGQEQAVEQPIAPSPVAAAVVPAPEIGFDNRAAVRAGFFTALLASALIFLPLPPVILFLWWLILLLAAGFFSVYLYIRRTREHLTTRRGAKMGWITGVFCFVILLVFLTVNFLILTNADANWVQANLDKFQASGLAEGSSKELMALLKSPTDLAGVLLQAILMLFCLFTILPTIGGILGANVLERE